MRTRSWAPVTPRSARAGPWAQTRDSITVFPTVATLNAPSSDGRHRRWLFSRTLGITRFLVFLQTCGRKAPSSACLLGLSDHRPTELVIPATSFPFWVLCACFPVSLLTTVISLPSQGRSACPFPVVCTVNIFSPSWLVFQFLGIPSAHHGSSLHTIARALSLPLQVGTWLPSACPAPSLLPTAPATV